MKYAVRLYEARLKRLFKGRQYSQLPRLTRHPSQDVNNLQ